MQPFTYHLFHKPTGLHYYGARYSKDCAPTDLWTVYFSSSPLVKDLIKTYGADSFTFEIRKVFNNAESALEWEHRVLTKLGAADNKNWLNRHNGSNTFKGPDTHSIKTRAKISRLFKGKPKSEEQKAKMKIKAKEREEKRRVDGWTMPKDAITRAVETRNKNIAAGIINPYSDERNSKMAETKRGAKRKYLPDGSFVMIKP